MPDTNLSQQQIEQMAAMQLLNARAAEYGLTFQQIIQMLITLAPAILTLLQTLIPNLFPPVPTPPTPGPAPASTHKS